MMLEFLAALILAVSFAASGDPEPPGDNLDADPPIIVSGGGAPAPAPADPPIVVQGGG